MLSVGDILKARYRIDSFLGRGGMADVYLAFDLRRQTHLAIKVLREDLAEDPEFVRRFQREGEALARLDHPYVVRFYAFEVDGPVAFIVMDYVPGSTLRRRLSEAQGPLPLDEVTHILRQVAAALQYAHNEGYIHRDVKPGNIMLREDGAALLSDFGIVRAAETTTMTMGPVGTPAYMSPEQIQGREVTPQTDIYSLGVVLFEMVTGRRPFSGEEGTGTNTIERVRYAHLHLAPPDPRSLNKELPEGASQVILRALAKEPARRWSDAMSLVRGREDALGLGHEAVVGGRTAVAVPSKPSTGPVTPRDGAVRVVQPGGAQGAVVAGHVRARQPWLAVAGVVGVVIVALIALLMIMPPARPKPGPTAGPVPTVPTPTPSTAPTPDVNATAIALVTQIARQTGAVETAVAAAVARTADVNTATAARAASVTVAARQTANAAQNATSTAESARRAEEASSLKTREAEQAAATAYWAERTATAAAETATREAQLASTAAVSSRQTDQARQQTAVAYQTSIAQPRIRCFEARRRHWEKSQAGGGEIAGIIYDRNGARFSGAQVHLYIKASNLEWYLRPAADGIYTFCCLAFSANNLHVVELTGSNIITTRTYEFYINNFNQNKVLVDFYEVSCP